MSNKTITYQLKIQKEKKQRYNDIQKLYWSLSKAQKLAERDKIKTIMDKLNLSQKTVYRALDDIEIKAYRLTKLKQEKTIKNTNIDEFKKFITQEKVGQKQKLMYEYCLVHNISRSSYYKLKNFVKI